jgi:hypothetical protein
MLLTYHLLTKPRSYTPIRFNYHLWLAIYHGRILPMQGTLFSIYLTALNTNPLFATNDHLSNSHSTQQAAMTNTAHNNMPRRNMGYPAQMSYPVPAADEVVILHSAIALVRSQLSPSKVIPCLLTYDQERPKSPTQCV